MGSSQWQDAYPPAVPHLPTPPESPRSALSPRVNGTFQRQHLSARLSAPQDCKETDRLARGLVLHFNPPEKSAGVDAARKFCAEYRERFSAVADDVRANQHAPTQPGSARADNCRLLEARARAKQRMEEHRLAHLARRECDAVSKAEEVAVEFVSTRRDVSSLNGKSKGLEKRYQAPGYCYLRFFPRSARKSVQGTLGKNPPMNVVAAELLLRYPEIRTELPAHVDLEFTDASSASSHLRSSLVRAGPANTRRIFLLLLRLYPLYSVGSNSGYDALQGTVHRDNVAAALVQPTLQALNDRQRSSRFAVGKALSSLLGDKGVPVNPYAMGSHKHPAHKTIEDYFLNDIVPGHISEPCLVVHMKTAKFNRLRARNANFNLLHNFSVTVRDEVRYPQSSAGWPVDIQQSALFLHDSGHYYRASDVTSLFKRYPKVERIFFTGILPFEAIHRRASCYPELYELEYHKDGTYSYVLEGDHSDHYDQPYETLEWLAAKSVTDVDTGSRYGFTRLDSRFAHGLYVVSRRAPLVEEHWRMFDVGDHIHLPNISGSFVPPEHNRLPTWVFRGALTHALGLRTKTLESVRAKLRTWEQKDECKHISAQTWVAAASEIYALSCCQVGIDSPILGDSGMASLARFLKEDVRSFFGHFAKATIPLVSGSSAALLLPAIVSFLVSSPSATLTFLSGWVASPAFAIPLACLLLGLAIGFLGRKGTPGSELRDLMSILPDKRIAKIELRCLVVRATVPASMDLPPPYSVDEMLFDSNDPHDSPNSSRSPSPAPSSHSGSSGNSNDFSTSSSDQPPARGRPVVKLPPLEEVHHTANVKTENPEEVRPVTAGTDSGAPVEDFKLSESSSQPLYRLPSPPAHTELHPLRECNRLAASEVFEPDHLWSFGKPSLEETPPPFPRQCCILDAISTQVNRSNTELWNLAWRSLPARLLRGPEVDQYGLTNEVAVALSYQLGFQVQYFGDIPPEFPDRAGLINPKPLPDVSPIVRLKYEPGHWSAYGTVPISSLGTAVVKSATSFRAHAIAPTEPARDPFLRHLLDDGDSFGNKAIDSVNFYQTNPKRAKAYARDLKAGTTGTVRKQEGQAFPTDYTKSCDSMLDGASSRKVVVAYRMGAGGCAKSSPFYSALKEPRFLMDNSWRVAVPRVTQRQRWSDKLKLPSEQNWKIGTFETSLTKNSRFVIIDEISQIPSGYVDFIAATQPNVRGFILLGDVAQGRFFEANPDSTINSIPKECDYFANFAPNYWFWSHRIPRAISRATGIPTTSKEEGFIKRANRLQPHLPAITPSTVAARTLTELGVPTMTYSSSQGEDSHQAMQIVVDNNTCLAMDNGLLATALTRSKRGVYVIVTADVGKQKQALSNPLLAALLNKAHPSVDFLSLFRKQLEGVKILYNPDADNSMVPVRGGDPGTEVQLPTWRASDNLASRLLSSDGWLPKPESYAEDIEPGPPTSLCPESIANACLLLGELQPREEREVYVGEDWSKEFDDQPKYLTDDGLYVEQMFPRQSDSDPVVKSRAVAKRLRFRSRSDNVADLRAKEWMGPVLLDSFCRGMHISADEEGFDADLYEACILENEFVKLTQKTQSTLLNNADRADADWPENYVRIFTKGQLKVKMETLHCAFKDGQTIASFQDQVILFTGPMTRYLVHKINRLCPDNVYFHSGKSPRALSAWCQSFWKSEKINTTNDYTSFDQSQTGETLSFERSLLDFFNIPEWLKDWYTESKMDLVCQYGHLQTMRFTGEGPTWLFNTLFNFALIYCQYEMRPSQPVAVSGDDMAINGCPSTRPTWPRFSRFLTIVAKTERKKSAEFCSWLLTPHGSFKNPVVTLAKLRIAMDKGEENLVGPSYAAEVAVGYRLGDFVYEILDERQMVCHAALVRWLVTTQPARFSLMFSWRSIEDVLQDLDMPSLTKAMIAGLSTELWMLSSGILQRLARSQGFAHVRGLVRSSHIARF